jgi:hypothetical protein
MTESNAKKVILQRWMAIWPGLSGNTPFVFDNDVMDESAAYARVKFRTGPSEQYSLGKPGNRRYLRQGQVAVYLCTPANAGSAANDALVEAVRGTLEGVTIPGATPDIGVCLYAGSTSPGPVDAQFFRQLVVIPYELIEIR